MRSETEVRQVAERCEELVNTLPSMHPLIDFYHGIQRGLSWALGDIDQAWMEQEIDIGGSLEDYYRKLGKAEGSPS